MQVGVDEETGFTASWVVSEFGWHTPFITDCPLGQQTPPTGVNPSEHVKQTPESGLKFKQLAGASTH